ncbi:FAD-dependent thymidylate synthase [Candidatus Woesearchaeota archaeon]|nr:FAD-dependent thymidylate synthase [Candidatus Woesearchaeota archaeon]
MTGTLAPLVKHRTFSEPEKIVLDHFFTNTDKNIYCPTDKMPFPVWTFLVGQYSRTPVSMRERFLNVFDEMKKKVEKGDWPKNELVTVEQAADVIASSKDMQLDYFFKTAEQFLAKWGVKFGHNSLKDADMLRVAIEGVTQTATNFIEMPDPELGAYQEKSTRYIPFSRDDVVIPPRLQASRFGARTKALNDARMVAYERGTPFVRKWLEENIVLAANFKDKGAFTGTLTAKTFDMMRYFLPLGLTTSLGATWPTRVAETHLSQMMSHPTEELQMLGKHIWEEGVKITPGLLKHVKPNDYFGQTTAAMGGLTDRLLPATPTVYHRGDSGLKHATLLHATPGLEDLLITGMLYEFTKNQSFEAISQAVKGFTDAQKDEVFREYLSRRGDHDLMMRGTKLGQFLFEYCIDHGAARDVKRQRVGTMLHQRIGADEGYSYPEFLEHETELAPLKAEYEQLMEETSRLYNEVYQEFPEDACYIPSMGHLGRWLYEHHSRQGSYVVELRTPDAGHFSYRRLFQEEFLEIEKVAPRFAKYIRAVMTKTSSGRQDAEERATAKERRALDEDRKRAAQ